MPHAMFPRRHVLHSTTCSPSSLNVHSAYIDLLKVKASIAVTGVVRPMTLSPWSVDWLLRNLVTLARVIHRVVAASRFAVPVYSFSEPPTQYLATSGFRVSGVAVSAMSNQLLNASRALSLVDPLPYRSLGSSASGPSATCCDLVTRRKDTSAGISWLSLSCYGHQNITSRQDLEVKEASVRKFLISLFPQGDRSGEPFPRQLEPRFRQYDLQYKRARKKWVGGSTALFLLFFRDHSPLLPPRDGPAPTSG